VRCRPTKSSTAAEGNVASHVFDFICPGQSVIFKNLNPSKGHDYGIIPNSEVAPMSPVVRSIISSANLQKISISIGVAL
jgi:hypothetical protein